MGSSYIVGGFIPLIPYFALGGNPAIAISVALAVTTLFIMGAGKALIVRRNPITSGLEMMAVGAAVAGIGYLVGVLLPAP
jgi:predicted membrane protein (TIGR00267 family)